jgi:hypothetical protein
MSRYRQQHLDKVQMEYEIIAAKNTVEKKIKEKKEDELKETMCQIYAH